jgi:NAD(P)-dependent dehydrogenase (short-subunit alcohol dehydrogenase family)
MIDAAMRALVHDPDASQGRRTSIEAFMVGAGFAADLPYLLSEMWSGLSGTERDVLRRRVAAALPSGRMGTPDDIAHAAIFLMTSRQTTGAVLEVSGGESLIDRLD